MSLRDQVSLFTMCSKQELEFLKSSKTRSCDLWLISRKKGRSSRKRRPRFTSLLRKRGGLTVHKTALEKQSCLDSEHLMAEIVLSENNFCSKKCFYNEWSTFCHKFEKSHKSSHSFHDNVPKRSHETAVTSTAPV